MRLWPALLLSIAAHVLVLRPWPLPPLPAQSIASAPLTLRLQALPPAPQAAPPPALQAALAPSTPSPAPRPLLPLAPRYLPLSELSSKPRFVRFLREVEAIDVPNLPTAPIVVHLFINESGSVDQVTLDDNGLPALARQWTIERFRAMQFSPGMLAGLPVKAQLQTEFNVEDSPASMPLAR